MIQVTPDLGANPFAILSFIVAPAILTNASSVLALSTSNRLARTIDRARELARQLDEGDPTDRRETDRRLRELAAAEHRALLLIRGLRSFYAALGGFAAAALLSIVGAVLVSMEVGAPVLVFEIVAVVVGGVAVGALVHGSVMLVRETRLVVRIVSERAAGIRRRLGSSDPPV